MTPNREIDIVVCVPTFRRPDWLARTLGSLVAQSCRRPFAVVVAENDAAGQQGADVASEVFATGQLQGLTVVEKRQGNCHAINAAFGTALTAFPAARYVLMIDDDEWAEPGWLEAMVSTAERTGAGVVGGPVMPQIARGGPAALVSHPAFRPAFDISGPVPKIYGSGNCLIARTTFDRLGLPAFDLAYNFLGGGDTDFFTRAERAGIRFQWVQEAVIRETVPVARTTMRWLARRGLRIGAINHRIELKHAVGGAGRLAVAAKSLGVLAISLVRGLRLLAETRQPKIALHPLLVAIGRCLAAAGIEPQEYRAAAPK
ncbi:glycosyltransferase family 2 protein [Methylobacterium brachythecii]|uniref:Glycosyl transferase family A n=1 Tax=Methylobacterium brachythecii TaxID=1176177 RepID=A0A7W6ARI0_9HYPH|nr:glycosyltransferase [Methylobacterium brachythecii]MBB3904577.1 glycosyltransferase involved in cell wall biosynthesis [Methylobacterium brachythecii]GLS46360.1 glycosyl transferase family A [Methylobacterium brachythecii]